MKPDCTTLPMVGLVAAMILLQACSEPATTGAGASPSEDAATSVAMASPADAPGEETAAAESLAFEWSANGFEQLPAEYEWSGSRVRDADFQPHFSLGVPETDDIVWSSACTTDGQVSSALYFNPPADMNGEAVTFRFGTDTSNRVRSYPARYVEEGMAPSFRIVQPVNDAMFADMRAGSWAHAQIGEGAGATKLRISLAGAGTALDAFLPACANSVPTGSAAAAREEVEEEAVVVRYACEDGETITATYLGNDSDTPTVHLDLADGSFVLQSVVSASGARYEVATGPTPGKSLAWHTKADSALRIEADPGDIRGDTETVVSCTEIAD